MAEQEIRQKMEKVEETQEKRRIENKKYFKEKNVALWSMYISLVNPEGSIFAILQTGPAFPPSLGTGQVA